MTTFALDLARFADKVRGRADAVVGDVVVQISAALDRRSPVGDRERWDVNKDRKAKGLPLYPPGYIGGHFRGNWQLGVGVIPTGEIPGVDPTGANLNGRVIAKIPEDAAGKVYWLANNVPYARRLEDGHSSQRPKGLVGLTAIEFPQMVEQAVASNGGGQ